MLIGVTASWWEQQFSAISLLGAEQRVDNLAACQGSSFRQRNAIEPMPSQGGAEQIAGALGRDIDARMRDDIDLRAGESPRLN